MPYVRIEIQAGWPEELKQSMLREVDAVLVHVLGVPPGECFIRIVPFARGDAVIPGQHGDRFALVQIQLFSGRTLGTKKRLYREMVVRLSALGIPEDDITVLLQEIPLENWGIRGGQAASELLFSFPIGI